MFQNTDCVNNETLVTNQILTTDSEVSAPTLHSPNNAIQAKSMRAKNDEAMLDDDDDDDLSIIFWPGR
eukprot:gene7349-biopygen7781